MFGSMARLFELAGQHKSKMLLSVVLASLSVAAGMVPYFIIQKIIMEFIAGSPQPEYLKNLALLAGASLLLKIVLFAKATSLSHQVAYKILYNTRIKLAHKLAKLPLGYLTGRASGELKKVMLDDVEKLELFLAHNLPETTSNIIIPVMVTNYLFILDWRMAVAMLLTIPLAYKAFMLMMKDYRGKMEKLNAATERMNAAIVEYVKGMAVIKAFNQTTASFAKYSDSVKEYQNFVREWFRYSWPYMSAYLVILQSSLLIVIPAGAYFYLTGSLELSVYILFLVISMGFAAPILKLTEFFDTIAVVAAAEVRIHEVLKEKKLYETDTGKNTTSNFSLAFSNVRFSYGREEVIKGISFTAGENTTTALVGPSGSGKSTVAKLVARFWDINEGEITIGGLNIREVPVNRLMEMVSFVFQDVFLFNVSIKENIRIGRPDADDEAVVEAAKLAQCHEFITRTAQGYDTVVGDAGSKLSGGEKQRISIARAILRDAPVIVLDEATASVDPENEDKIQEALSNLTQGKTLIVIAHRLSTIIHADKILVINDGNIEAEGTHEELLRNSLLYKNMWNAHIEARDWNFALEEVSV